MGQSLDLEHDTLMEISGLVKVRLRLLTILKRITY